MPRHPLARSFLTVFTTALLLAPRLARAQPIVVIAARAGAEGPDAATLDAVARATGSAALAGAALARAVAQAADAQVPDGDPLADARASVARGEARYYEGRHRYALADELLRAGCDALRAEPVAAATLPANRAALATAVYLRARIALERREPAHAEALVRELRAWDPGGAPDERAVPPSVVALWRRVAAEGAPGGAAGGALVVDADRAGCTARLDARELGPTPARADGVVPGVHAVGLACGEGSLRVRRVDVAAGETSRVRFGAPLPRALASGSEPELRYATAADAARQLTSDAARLGRALGARRVAVVTRGVVVVVDPATAREAARVPATAPIALVRAAVAGLAVTIAPPARAARTRGRARLAIHPAALVLGGLALGAAGAGVGAEIVAHPAGRPDDRALETAGLLALGAAGAWAATAVVAGVVLRGRPDAARQAATPRVAIVPSAGGAGAVLTAAF